MGTVIARFCSFLGIHMKFLVDLSST